MKIASWNVNSLNIRLPHLDAWLRAAAPDIVALQETKLDDERFPDTELAGLGYRSVFAGQKTYNGVAILARDRAIGEVQVGIPGFDTFSKQLPVFRQARMPASDWIKPPYRGVVDRMIRFLAK